MGFFLDMLLTLLRFFLLGVPGFLLARMGKIEARGRAALVNVLLYVAMPCLVFKSLLETDVHALHAADFLIAFLFPVLITAALIPLGMLAFRKHGDLARSCLFCATFSNCGFLGIPLAESLFGSGRVVLFVSLYNITATVLLFVVGGVMLSGNGKKQSFVKLLLSPLTVATLLGILCSLLHVNATRAAWMYELVRIPAAMTTPLSLTVLGCLLASLPRRAWWRDGGLWKTAGIKLVAAPVIAMAVLLLCRLCRIPLGQELAVAMLLSVAVSTAASAPSMVEEYGGDPHYAAALTVGNTLLCLVTLPPVYLLFCLLFL